MKVLRIVIALLLTAAMLYIAKRTSRGHPEEFAGTSNGFTLKMTTVPKGQELSQARIDVNIAGPVTAEVQPVLRYARSEQGQNLTDLSTYQTSPLILADSTKGDYFAVVSTGPRGQRLDYYFEIRESRGQLLADFKQPDGTPWGLRYIGEVPKPVLIGHIGFIFATFLGVALAAMFGIGVISGSQGVKPMATFLGLSTLCAFIGGYPFGFAMNWFAFGGIWEGVPFGTDATDNKTQLLLVYLLFATLISLGSLTNRKFGRDVFAPKSLGWFGVGAIIVSLLIYLIPHSIQFSAAVTYSVCYAFIVFWMLVYLYGFFASRSSAKGSVR